jgi:hypothetical protein
MSLLCLQVDAEYKREKVIPGLFWVTSQILIDRFAKSSGYENWLSNGCTIYMRMSAHKATNTIVIYCRAYSVATIIRRVIGLTTGFIGSHTVTHNYSAHALTAHYSSLAESPHCIFTLCLSSNIAGSVRLQLCNSSLKTAARPEYSLVTVHVANS